MKKSLFIVAAFVAVSFSSCKKDRVCECVSSTSAGASPAQKTTYVDVTKGQMKANCFTSKWDQTDASGATVTVTNTCTIK